MKKVLLRISLCIAVVCIISSGACLSASVADDVIFSSDNYDSQISIREVSLVPTDYAGFKMAICVDQINQNDVKPDQISSDGRTCYFGLTKDECIAIFQDAEPISLGPNGSVLWLLPGEQKLMVQHGKILTIMLQAVNRGAKDIRGILADEIQKKCDKTQIVVDGEARWSSDGRYVFLNEKGKWFGITFEVVDPYLLDTETGEIFFVETDGKVKSPISELDRFQYIVNGRFSNDGKYFDYNIRKVQDDVVSYTLKRFALETGEFEEVYVNSTGQIIDFCEIGPRKWMVVEEGGFGHNIVRVFEDGSNKLTTENEMLLVPAGASLSIVPLAKEKILLKADFHHHLSSLLVVDWNEPKELLEGDVWLNINNDLHGKLIESDISDIREKHEDIYFDALDFNTLNMSYINQIADYHGTDYLILNVHINRPLTDTWDGRIQSLFGILLLDYENLTIMPVKFWNKNVYLGDDSSVYDNRFILGNTEKKVYQFSEQDKKTDYLVISQLDETIEKGNRYWCSSGSYYCDFDGKFLTMSPEISTIGVQMVSGIVIKEDGYEISISAEKDLEEDCSYLIPEAITVERFNSFIEKLSSKHQKQMRSNYYLSTPEKISRWKNGNEIMLCYPSTADKELYIIKTDTSRTSLERIESLFAEAGYSEADYLIDNEEVRHSMLSDALKSKKVHYYYYFDKDYTVSRTEALQLAGLCDRINSAIYYGYLLPNSREDYYNSDVEGSIISSVLQKHSNGIESYIKIYEMIHETYIIDGIMYSVEVSQIEEIESNLNVAVVIKRV